MLKILYAGSPTPSALTLKTLLNDSDFTKVCKIVGVLTNPPATHGRHKTLIPTPVQICAEEYGIQVFTPEHLNADSRTEVIKLKADILVCFAYGHIFGPKFLSIFQIGAINLHPSLLPQYRGPTPVQTAILNRDTETGISIQKIALETDAGDIIKNHKIILDGTETSVSLLEKSAVEGAFLLSEILQQTAETKALPSALPQSGIPTYTKIIQKTDGKIDWNKSAAEIEARIRAYTPDPGCYTECNGIKLKIIQASISLKDFGEYKNSKNGTVIACSKDCGILVKTGKGLLSLDILQWESKKALCCRDFMNGARDFGKTVLG